MHELIRAAADRITLIVPAETGAVLFAAAILRKLPNADIACAVHGWSELDPASWPANRAVIIISAMAFENLTAPSDSLSMNASLSDLPALICGIADAGHELLSVIESYDNLLMLDAVSKLAGIDILKLPTSPPARDEGGPIVPGSLMDSLVFAIGHFKAGRYQSLLYEAALYCGGLNEGRAAIIGSVLEAEVVDAAFIVTMIRRIAAGEPPLNREATEQLAVLHQGEAAAQTRLVQAAERLSEALPEVWLLRDPNGLALPHGKTFFPTYYRRNFESTRHASMKLLIYCSQEQWIVVAFGSAREFIANSTTDEFMSATESLPVSYLKQTGTIIAADLDGATRIAELLANR